MSLESLNEFSKRFAKKLLESHPDLEAFCSVDQNSKVEAGTLLLRIPPGSNNLCDGLWASTHDGEVIVGFDTHHAHFKATRAHSEEDSFVDAVEHIGNILSEKILAVAWYRGDRCRGGMPMSPGENPSPPRILGIGVNRIRVRSWNGTYDEDRQR